MEQLEKRQLIDDQVVDESGYVLCPKSLRGTIEGSHIVPLHRNFGYGRVRLLALRNGATNGLVDSPQQSVRLNSDGELQLTGRQLRHLGLHDGYRRVAFVDAHDHTEIWQGEKYFDYLKRYMRSMNRSGQ